MNQKVVTALITPFKQDGSLDLKGFKFLIERQVAVGIHGILILGSTGEGTAITDFEREQLIETARRCIEPPTELWVGTTAQSTSEAIRLTKQAKSLGADVALVAVPSYILPTEEGICAHIASLQEIELPICFYHIPKRTGIKLSLNGLLKLLAMPFVTSLKECSQDLSLLMDIIQHKPDAKIYAGDDATYLAQAAVGVQGVVSVMSNVFPEKMYHLADLIEAVHYDEAKTYFYSLYPLMKSLFNITNPIGVKGALNFLRLPAGPLRAPLNTFKEDALNSLEQQLLSYVS